MSKNIEGFKRIPKLITAHWTNCFMLYLCFIDWSLLSANFICDGCAKTRRVNGKSYWKLFAARKFGHRNCHVHFDTIIPTSCGTRFVSFARRLYLPIPRFRVQLTRRGALMRWTFRNIPSMRGRDRSPDREKLIASSTQRRARSHFLCLRWVFISNFQILKVSSSHPLFILFDEPLEERNWSFFI